MLTIHFSTRSASHLPELEIPMPHAQHLPEFNLRLTGAELIEHTRETLLPLAFWSDWSETGIDADFDVYTTSEHIVLTILHHIRNNPTTAKHFCFLWYNERQLCSEIRHDENGEFIDRVPQGFYSERAQLLF